MFERLRRWLSGAFVCTDCGEHVNLMTFGFGGTICPDCYDYQDEPEFIFLDMSFWLNRVLHSISIRG